MADLSKAACRLSIQHLFREAEHCHLWTYTFPDDVPPKEAARRWRLFVRWHVETGRKCVRVLESGSWHGRWHYHCVTPERWNVNEVREAAERYGFGRINVKRLPAERAHYVAKYLGKQNRGDLPPGQRRWACVGFEGVPVNRVKASSTTRHLPKISEGKAYTALVWHWGNEDPSRHEIRKVEPPGVEEVQHLYVSVAEADAVMADLDAGKIMMVGEYRGLTITHKVLKDPVTKTKIETAFVEHVITSSGNVQTVSEWLPAGADLDAVALPVQPGTVVKVHLESIRVHMGQQYLRGIVKPLLEPSGCRNESQQVALNLCAPN